MTKKTYITYKLNGIKHSEILTNNFLFNYSKRDPWTAATKYLKEHEPKARLISVSSCKLT